MGICLLCEWKNCEVEEFNVQVDYVHLVAPIPSKVSVSELTRVLKGKLTIKVI
ncbi:MAG: transposase [Prevotellaceae bacterium]|nr:transposase [Prevotellaceae bacterium]